MTERILPVRVWLAQRLGTKSAQAMDELLFKKRLCESFIPVTHQWMSPFGMTDYLVTLWPRGADPALQLPDESALVFYQSVPHYDAMRQTPTGRLYGDAHSLVFDPGMNRGGYPSEYQPDTTNASALGKPYFGFDDEPDFAWNTGAIWALALRHPNAPPPADWVKERALPCLAKFPPHKQWIGWSTTEWTALWVRCPDANSMDMERLKQELAALSPASELLFLHRLEPVVVPVNPLTAFAGVTLAFDQSVRISA